MHRSAAWISATPLRLAKFSPPVLIHRHVPQRTVVFSSSSKRIHPRLTAEAPSSDPATPPPSTPDPRGIISILPYAAIVAAQALPLLIPDSGIAGDLTYFSVTAVACILIGVSRAPFETILSPPLSGTQALVAPFAASTFLFGSYLLLKYTSFDVAALFNTITTFGGALCAKEALDPIFHSILAQAGLEKRVLWPPKPNPSDSENVPPAVTLPGLCSTTAALAVTAAYLLHVPPTYVFSNFLAVCICTRVLAMVRPASFVVATSLLCGLFLYDIFWVFGSEVMVSVATQIDAPAKLLFPRGAAEIASGAVRYPYAILGLGDVCVPGLFAALASRIDKRLGDGKEPYFAAAMTAYGAGLLTCFGVNVWTGAAQPALLYLVPALIGSTLLVGGLRGELGDVISFREKEEMDSSSSV